MKTLSTFCLAVLLNLVVICSAQAALVDIPDPNFRAFLQGKYPTCFVGNQLETTCSEVLAEQGMGVSGLNISDLTGVQYFINLNTLDCSNNQLTTLPALPSSIAYLTVSNNQLAMLPTLPASLIRLDCSTNALSSLPTLPSGLTHLLCQNNQLTALPNLPSTMIGLVCATNRLNSLPSLPSGLISLTCYENQLTSLPSLPSALQSLTCFSNQLTSLPALPSALITISCTSNLLTSLPVLPSSLQQLQCASNQLTTLPALPSSLTTLYCYQNQLSALPALPSAITTLLCGFNSLTSLPTLPSSLTMLDCQDNQLSSLPLLPNSLCNLYCNDNNITCLPNIPTCSNFYSSCGTNLCGTISTGSISVSSICGNSPVAIPFTVNGTFNSSNIFTAQLSDASGSFANPTNIGTLNGTSSGTINAVIPSSLANGSSYRVRVVSSNPSIIGTDNGADISVNSNYVYIPDANFRAYLSTTFPGSIVGNCLNTTASSVVNATTINASNKNISDLTGIQYFINLNTLILSNNQLTTLPTLPNSLSILTCDFNQLTSLPTLPSSLTVLQVGKNQLISIPTLPATLTKLDLSLNKITSVPTLPSGLKEFYCTSNKLTSIPSLPSGLINLSCGSNLLTSIPALPSTLIQFYCSGNQITSLPALPSSLTFLACANNQLTSLPALPNTLCQLDCAGNNITCLPNTPTCSTFTSTCGINSCNSITTSALSVSSICGNSPVSISFTVNGSYNSGNIFTAQLSDASGSFANPTNIGTLNGTTSGTVNAVLPSSLANGTSYRVRVVSSSPSIIGTNNGANLTINSSYVYIPDANFRSYLSTTFAGSIVGNCLNTTASSVLNGVTIDVSNKSITDLTGVQYFTKLQNLFCNNNQLTSLPPLPSTLTSLFCSSNQLTSLPALPNSLQYLVCENNLLIVLDPFPASLYQLNCGFNKLTSLPALPAGVRYLSCQSNQITSLPVLSGILESLTCDNNKLTSLPALPNTITMIHCAVNQITTLPTLPTSLQTFFCGFNKITALPTLPNSLCTLNCAGNLFTCLPNIPTCSSFTSTCGTNLCNTITTGAISVSSICGNSPVAIPFTVNGSYNSSNIFTAQLSDASGSFASPTNIGTLNGSSSGTINAVIPSSLANGSSYRVRVVSSNPSIIGTDNGADISVNSNYVYIPDANFRAYLNTTFPGSIVGTCLNITHNSVITANTIDITGLNISDVTGIQYFVNLQTLLIRQNTISQWPVLPAKLTFLDCSSNLFTTMGALPGNLQALTCDENKFTSLPTLPNTVTSLSCYGNQLTSLPILPTSLTYLACFNNQLTSLPALPNTIKFFTCHRNQLTSLPTLPTGLEYLNCQFNLLTSLPTLPGGLKNLSCFNNQLSSLPALPASLTELYCHINLLTSLPALPPNLNSLICYNNQLTSLPTLPNSLCTLDCAGNSITCLPNIPTCPSFTSTCGINTCLSLNTTALGQSSYCASSTVQVAYTIKGVYNSDNVFTAQLSDASGSFASPVSIGTVTSTSAGTINATMPASPTAGTGYRIRVVASSPAKIGTDNGSNLTLNSSPGALSINGSISPCALSKGNIYSVTNTNGSTYAWTLPAGSSIISGAGTSSISVNFGNTSGAISVIQTNSNGCAGNPASLSVSLKAAPAVKLTSSQTSVCPDVTVNLTASGAQSYVWTAADGLKVKPQDQTSATFKNSVAAVYPLTVTGTGANGCTNDATVTITVNPIPVITVTPSAPSICKGNSVTLTASGAATYQWSYGNNNSTGSTIVANPTITMNYKVSGVSAQGCSTTNFVSTTVTVIDLSAPTIIPDCNRLTTTALGMNYQWNYGGVPIPGANSVDYYPTKCGDHSLTVSNSIGCSATTLGYYVVGTGSSPAMKVAATSDDNGNGMIVYPNPNQGSFSITADAKVKVLDINGVTVYEKVVTDLSELKDIDMSAYASGTYVVQLIIGETVVSKRMIVNK